MKTLKIIIISLITLVILVGTVFFVMGFLQPKPGGILVSTNPASSVYVNGTLVGKTPFKGAYKSGEITIKLVPEDNGANLLPFETRLTLAPGIQTVVRREFGPSEDLSSGDITSFDKGNTKETGLVVVTTPENAQISLDGVPRGFAPYKTLLISPAQHQITIKASGYVDRVMTSNTIEGYKLTIFAKLAKGGDDPSVLLSTATPAPVAKTYILIMQTPTGFLRVRTEPGSTGEEIAEVKPGSKYLFLQEDSATHWYKIQYEDPQPGLPNGITGWVSNQFAKKVDDKGNDATGSATPVGSQIPGTETPL